MKYPSVLVGIPVKNSELWLAKCLESLEKLDYPSNKIRVIFLYGESRDRTLNIIKVYSSKSKYTVEAYRETPMNIPKIPVSAAFIAPIYKDYQELIEEDYFWLLDSDIIKFDPVLLKRLVSLDVDVVAPYVWIIDRDPRIFFDIYCFRYKGYHFHPINPPGINNNQLLEIDSVGSCYVVKAEVFKKGVYKNPHPHLQFCNSIRNLGYKVYIDPKSHVYHYDLEKAGIFHLPIEVYLGKPMKPQLFIDSNNNVKNSDEISKELSRIKKKGITRFGPTKPKLELLKYCKGSVLDIGCATKWVKDFINNDYLGIDIRFSPDILASALFLPFRDKVFDTTLLIDVIEHTVEPFKCLLEAKRVAKKLILFSVPECKKSHSEADPTHLYSFERPLLFRLINKIGHGELLNLDPNTIFGVIRLEA